MAPHGPRDRGPRAAELVPGVQPVRRPGVAEHAGLPRGVLRGEQRAGRGAFRVGRVRRQGAGPRGPVHGAGARGDPEHGGPGGVHARGYGGVRAAVGRLRGHRGREGVLPGVYPGGDAEAGSDGGLSLKRITMNLTGPVVVTKIGKLRMMPVFIPPDVLLILLSAA
ncbi:hypothetical protein ASPACDRAFT_1885052 [Aspergillus aculeatus ATCC 16872]|uniref:Uncharacterized protein n=1 Tax=Aspergillus aculeatus (strain ATCC 16872 / CBS 172.66 / WB 5094) TaxID=690307 RepID=A0A1L9X4X0_ASPA1|nr:uncharacterized protein ASPACDRAFT_1885052 [Aspergillus aculeatus ATCC 16872]OJK03495.1 hypothetical protein ASPACDRAFT_1885052 [Aspergillus aculeatus ATCC 16872]